MQDSGQFFPVGVRICDHGKVDETSKAVVILNSRILKLFFILCISYDYCFVSNQYYKQLKKLKEENKTLPMMAEEVFLFLPHNLSWIFDGILRKVHRRVSGCRIFIIQRIFFSNKQWQQIVARVPLIAACPKGNISEFLNVAIPTQTFILFLIIDCGSSPPPSIKRCVK